MENHNNQKIGTGGDAGEIFIAAKKIRGNGKITADGGDGSVGGKGGEITLVSEDNQFEGEVSAKGGRSDTTYKTPGKKIDWGMWGVIMAVVSIFVTLVWQLFTYIFPSPYTEAITDKTLDIDNSQGIMFRDSVIQGGTNVSGSQNIEFNKTRIVE